MTELRHLCGNCRECLKAERDILKEDIKSLEMLVGLYIQRDTNMESRIEKLEKHIAEIDTLIEKRKMLSDESFYSIDLRKLIELREGQRDANNRS